MSFRYLEYPLPQSADMLDAKDWVRNINVLAEEFNGRLDRDNLPERAVSASHTVIGTFNSLTANTRTSDITLSGDTSQWVDGDGTNTINQLTVTTETDGMLRVAWSGTWSWAAHISWGATPGGDSIGWRLIVDGTVIAESPYHNVLRYHDATHLCGTYPMSAGVHTVKVEARLYNWQSGARLGYDCDVETSELIAHLRLR
tara:strand:- start:3732 stop:4331 length:600 start_codon:yes stop_codon:yes gene_type:complete